jgi:hypothetical protein
MDTSIKFRTILEPKPLERQLVYSDSITAIGSCFAESIGAKLQRYGFDININPFGILYNPISITRCLNRLLDNQFVMEEELVQGKEGIYHHWLFHGRFSHLDKKEALRQMNSSLQEGRAHLLKSKVLMVTLGTSYVWVHKDHAEAVANCHKFPASEFTHTMINSNEFSDGWHDLLIRLEKEAQLESVIFSVSPVRYLQQGFVNNSLSKARLLMLADKMVKSHRGCAYFPAYELLLDDLRDYRFFADDMLHPSEAAIDYIWDAFTRSGISKESRKLMEEVEQIIQASEHRPRFPENPGHMEFCHKQVQKAEKLMQEHPGLNLEVYIDRFRNYL